MSINFWSVLAMCIFQFGNFIIKIYHVQAENSLSFFQDRYLFEQIETYLPLFFPHRFFFKRNIFKFSNHLGHEMYAVELYISLKLGCSFPKTRKATIFHGFFFLYFPCNFWLLLQST